MQIDPYFRPILITAGIVIVLNTLIFIPILSMPFVNYFMGGALVVYLFKKDIGKQLKLRDTSILGVGAGLVSGSILSLINAVRLSNPDFQDKFLEEVNGRIAMQGGDILPLDTFSPMFILVLTIVTIVFTSVLSFFGSLSAMALLERKKR